MTCYTLSLHFLVEKSWNNQKILNQSQALTPIFSFLEAFRAFGVLHKVPVAPAPPAKINAQTLSLLHTIPFHTTSPTLKMLPKHVLRRKTMSCHSCDHVSPFLSLGWFGSCYKVMKRRTPQNVKCSMGLKGDDKRKK